MQPTIGRAVHFVQGGVHFPAVITKTLSPVFANLYVYPNGEDQLGDVAGPTSHVAARVFLSVGRADVNGNGQAPDYSWHWPEREEA